MNRSWISRLLTRDLGHPSVRAKSRRPLGLEHLEDRTVPATVSWINSAGGDWDTASNWSTGYVPGASDDAVLNLSGNVTITHAGYNTDAVRSISGTDTLVLSNGSLSVSSDSYYQGAVTISGGTFLGTGDLTFDGLLTWNAGGIGGTGNTLAVGGVVINNTATNGVPGPTLDTRTFENAGTATWVGGNFNAGDGAVFENLKGATFDIETENATFDSTFGQQGTFQNAGTVTKLITTNTATFNTQFDNTGSVAVQTGTLDFNGGGTSTGKFTISSGATLGFSTGQYTLESGSAVTGAGTVQFGQSDSATYNLQGSFNPGQTVISNGFVYFDVNTTLAALTVSGGTLAGSATATVTGPLDWTGGVMSGVGATVSKGTLLIDPLNGGATELSGRTFDNAGTGVLAGSGTFVVVDGAVLNNLAGAAFTVETNATVGDPSESGTFTNDGTLTQAGTLGTTTVNALFDNNGTVRVESGTLELAGGGTSGGSFVVSAGADLTFSAGVTTLASTSHVSGAGSVAFQGGTTDVFGAYSAGGTLVSGGTVAFEKNVTVADLTMSSGVLTGPSTVTVTGLLDWTGGTMSGSGTTVATGAVTLDGSTFNTNSPTLDTRTFENAGTATWLGGNLDAGDGAKFENLKGANFDIESDVTFDSDFGAVGTFQNAGTVTKSITDGVTTFNTLFDNTGTVAVDSGIVNLNAGGTATGSFRINLGAGLGFVQGKYILQSGSKVTGAGTVQFADLSAGGTSTYYLEGTFAPGQTDIDNGTVYFDSSTTLASLTFAFGTLSGTAKLTVTGTFDWTGGTMEGTGTTVSKGTLLIDSINDAAVLVSRAFDNEGAATLSGSGTLTVGAGAVLDNFAGATVTVEDNPGMGDGSGDGSFINNGTLTLTGTGTTLLVSAMFTSGGTVNLNGNGLTISGPYTQTAGTINLQEGTLTIDGNGLVLDAKASLFGAGTINGNVINSGLVDPGSTGSPEILTINGNYTQSGTGILQIQLGGTSPGSGGYDQLAVNGNAALDGTLSVLLANGFVPVSGDAFQFLTASSESGTFAKEHFPQGVSFQLTYDNNGATLTAE